jgi:hypothetical protein
MIEALARYQGSIWASINRYYGGILANIIRYWARVICYWPGIINLRPELFVTKVKKPIYVIYFLIFKYLNIYTSKIFWTAKNGYFFIV